jgi:penicillin-binding protein 1A
MVLGGLKVGVTPLEMAKSYETLAHQGERVSGTLAPYDGGPVTFTKVTGPGIDDQNHVRTKRVIPQPVAQEATSILQSVVTSGTGRSAQIGEFAAGKTGTTENYQDAWFVGFNDLMTVAVWVGYPEGAKPMMTEYHGQPVAGGTFPAEIWHDFMLSVKKIRDARALAAHKGATGASGPTGVPAVPVAPPVQVTTPSKKPSKRKSQTAPGTGGGNPNGGGNGGRTPAPTQPKPATPAEPPPQPTQPPSTGGGTGGAGGAPGTGGGTPPAGAGQ